VELLDRRRVRLRRDLRALRRRRRRRDRVVEAEPVVEPVRLAARRRVLEREAGEVVGERLVDVEGEQRRTVTAVRLESQAFD
jgi:hypothetical protein